MQGRHSVLSISIVLALGLTLPISPRLLAQSALCSARAEDSPVIPTSEKPALSTPSLEKSEEKKSPEKCKTGIYIVSLYDLNPNDSTFSSDFWIWFNHERLIYNMDILVALVIFRLVEGSVEWLLRWQTNLRRSKHTEHNATEAMRQNALIWV